MQGQAPSGYPAGAGGQPTFPAPPAWQQTQGPGVQQSAGGAAQQPVGGMPQQQQQGFASQQPSTGSVASGLPVLDQRYVATTEQVFLLKGKLVSMSGDDFTIQCITNPGLSFKLDASTVSIHGTRKLKEAHNSHVILNLKHRLTSDKTWHLYVGGDDSELLADIKGPGKVRPGDVPHAEVYLNKSTASGSSSRLKGLSNMFRSVTGNHPDFVVSGELAARSFTITHQSQLVGEISRQLVSETKSKHSFNSKDSYAVKVLPGQDCAFIIAIACMVDELFFDD